MFLEFCIWIVTVSSILQFFYGSKKLESTWSIVEEKEVLQLEPRWKDERKVIDSSFIFSKFCQSKMLFYSLKIKKIIDFLKNKKMIDLIQNRKKEIMSRAEAEQLITNLKWNFFSRTLKNKRSFDLWLCNYIQFCRLQTM